MEYNFDKVYDRMGSDSIKWEKQLKFGVPSGLTPFWIADTDFATLPQAVEAMRARLEHPIFGYTFTPEKVLEAVQGWYKRRHGVDLPVSAYATAHGVVTSIWFSIRAFTQEGDGVLVSTPVYDPFFVVIEDQNRKKVDCPLVYEDGAYHIDWEQLDAKLATVKAMIFCNPHNPTGNVWTAQEVERVVQLCKKHDVWLFSDEIHGDVALYGNRCTSAAQFAAEYDKMVVYTAISKTFNMAGLESSCNIIPNPDYKAALVNCMHGAWLMGPNCMANPAIAACYTYGDEWVDQMNAYLTENAEYVIHTLAEKAPAIKVVKPQGTYLMWLDFNAFGMTSKQITDELVKEYGVAVGDGSGYGNAEGFIRFNIGCPRATLEKGVEALCRFAASKKER